jgi:hypothetical protein
MVGILCYVRIFVTIMCRRFFVALVAPRERRADKLRKYPKFIKVGNNGTLYLRLKNTTSIR